MQADAGGPKDNPIGKDEYQSAMAASDGTAEASGHSYAEPKLYSTYTGFQGEGGQAGAVKPGEHSGEREENGKGGISGEKGHLGGKGKASATWSSGRRTSDAARRGRLREEAAAPGRGEAAPRGV